jgi:coenzyme F420-0:L-glutamate ligase/coenzyme F420-1:gamma-L-glutamate ligase
VSALEIHAPDGIGEIAAGADLAALVLQAVDLTDEDVLVVTSKVVSKAEGRVVRGTREDAVEAETVRVVARRGPTSIVENPLGLVMAAAGVDASNVAPGWVVLLPRDPDASARALRTQLYAAAGHNVAVVVTDTAGRAWRTGQADIAVGVAGLEPLDSFDGRVDGYGNPLAVTEPAVADEIASAAELATGKLGGRPFTVVRGLGERVLPRGEHGPGARALLRPRSQDMFALGSREAVVAAVAGADADCFGSPATASELVSALASCGIDAGAVAPDRVRTDQVDVPAAARAAVVAFAHRWQPEPTSSADRPEFHPSTP